MVSQELRDECCGQCLSISFEMPVLQDVGRLTSRLDEGFRIGDCAKDPPCIFYHLQSGEIVAVIGRAGAVGKYQALEATVVRVAHRCVNAHVGRDAREDDVLNMPLMQKHVEIGGVKGTLARLVDDRLANSQTECLAPPQRRRYRFSWRCKRPPEKPN